MHWLPARAHDNGLFLVFINGVGPDDNEVRTGNAMILDPYGDILAETWRVRELCIGVRWIRSRRPELYAMLAALAGMEEDTRRVDCTCSRQGISGARW